MQGKVVILTGNKRAGKTTLANKLKIIICTSGFYVV